MARSLRERMQVGYEAFSRGDFERLERTMIEDFKVHDHADPASPVHRGPDAIKQTYDRLREVFRVLTADVHEAMELGDRVVVRVRFTGRGYTSDAPGAQDMGHVWTVADDGRFSALDVYGSWDEALANADTTG